MTSTSQQGNGKKLFPTGRFWILPWIRSGEVNPLKREGGIWESRFLGSREKKVVQTEEQYEKDHRGVVGDSTLKEFHGVVAKEAPGGGWGWRGGQGPDYAARCHM